MFFFRRQDSPGFQLASSETQEEVISRLASGALLPTDEIFDTEHKKWLPLYEWIALASPAVRTESSQDNPRVHSTNQDTVLPTSKPNATTEETNLGQNRKQTSTSQDTVLPKSQNHSATEETNLGPNSQASSSTALPSHIGKYPIIKVLGSGGMGIVYQAKDPLTQDFLAIKVIHPHFASHPKAKKIFLEEAKAAIKFTTNSSFLVTTRSIEEDNGILFQVLEYIEWDTLLSAQEQVRKLGWVSILNLYQEITKGIQELHNIHVLHRDLKPSNVFIRHHNNQWNIKLADFGISLSEETTDLQQSMVKQAGTAFYMSPEQRKGEPCTNASDIYSLGVMLYETLTGEKVEGRYDPATEFIQDLPSEVDKIIDACVAQSQDKRIQATSQLLASLRAVLNKKGKEDIDKISTVFSARSENSNTKINPPRDNINFIPKVSFKSESVNSLAFSPDSNYLACGSFNNTAEVYSLTTNDIYLKLLGQKSSISSIDYSPDGKFIATGSSDNTVIIWNANTSNVHSVLNAGLSSVTCVSFSKDGQSLASGYSDGSIKIWERQHYTLEKNLIGHTKPVQSIAFSPDSTLLYSGSIDTTVKIWNVSTGVARSNIREHTDHVKSVAISPSGLMFASGSNDKTIRMWNGLNGAHMFSLRGHSGNVNCVTFSPCGNFLASGGSDCRVVIWNIATKNIIKILANHSNLVRTLAFSPNGQLLASGSFDKSILIWSIV
jgi:WD40 repeat protein